MTHNFQGNGATRHIITAPACHEQEANGQICVITGDSYVRTSGFIPIEFESSPLRCYRCRTIRFCGLRQNRRDSWIHEWQASHLDIQFSYVMVMKPRAYSPTSFATFINTSRRDRLPLFCPNICSRLSTMVTLRHPLKLTRGCMSASTFNCPSRPIPFLALP